MVLPIKPPKANLSQSICTSPCTDRSLFLCLCVCVRARARVTGDALRCAQPAPPRPPPLSASTHRLAQPRRHRVPGLLRLCGNRGMSQGTDPNPQKRRESFHSLPKSPVTTTAMARGGPWQRRARAGDRGPVGWDEQSRTTSCRPSAATASRTSVGCCVCVCARACASESCVSEEGLR